MPLSGSGEYLPAYEYTSIIDNVSNPHFSHEKLAYEDDTIREEVIAPYKYIRQLASNNKNVRTKFIHVLDQVIFKINDETVLSKMGEIIEQLHNASLLIDDIEDESLFRRGKPAAHIEFGTPLTINCGNLVYFEAFDNAYKLWREKNGNSEKLVELFAIFTQEMKNLHKGQGDDIYWRDNLTSLSELPSMMEYFQMAKNKTGGLFRLSIKLMALFSPVEFEKNFNSGSNMQSSSSLLPPSHSPLKKTKKMDDLITVANCLGIMYQVRDDYLNLVDSRYSHMKGVTGEDLFEGKLSFPILICLKRYWQEKRANSQLPNSFSCLVEFLYNHRSQQERMERKDLHEKAMKEIIESNVSSETFHCLMALKERITSFSSSISDTDPKPLLDLVTQLCDIF
ncbi:BTS1 [Candida oxycetoniae]|uniref:BTS1 n=1 Tax=Candida oxycetoniae TaxID=497107 RepID=A0AAI9SUG2_9ASCO|nr:BTS1 [Candida oxycetoniae]KAI3403276.2 BTS1 [Candida oxycetoniae]